MRVEREGVERKRGGILKEEMTEMDVGWRKGNNQRWFWDVKVEHSGMVIPLTVTKEGEQIWRVRKVVLGMLVLMPLGFFIGNLGLK